GILGSVAGLFLGLALAKGLKAVFSATGFDLPTAGTVFKPRTIVVCLVIGTVITLLASLRPAWRATRVPPIAAVREGAQLPPGRFAKFRPVGAALLTAAGFALLSYGLFGSGLETKQILISMGAGTLLIFIGVALLSARVTRMAVMAAGITKSFRGAVDDLWISGYAITAQNNFEPIPIAAGNAAAKTPGVEAIANVRGGDAELFGEVDQATAVGPGAAK